MASVILANREGVEPVEGLGGPMRGTTCGGESGNWRRGGDGLGGGCGSSISPGIALRFAFDFGGVVGA